MKKIFSKNRIFIGLLLLGSVSSAQTKDIPGLVLVNRSNEPVHLSHSDSLLNSSLIRIDPSASHELPLHGSDLLIAAKINHTPFFVRPGDTLTVTLKNDQLYELRSKDSVRNNEIGVFRALHEHFQYYPSAQDKLKADRENRALVGVPAKRDSLLLDRHGKAMNLLHQLTGEKQVAPDFVPYAENYLYYKLLDERLQSLNYKPIHEEKVYAGLKDSLIDLRKSLSRDEGLSLPSYRRAAHTYFNYLWIANAREKVYPMVDSLFSGATKDFLLTLLMRAYVKNDKPFFEKYYQRYMADCRNDNYKDYVAQLAGYERIKEKSVSSSGTLLSANEEQVTMDSLLLQYRGKKVYIDFWASWCAPCIAEMPQSRRLSARHTNTVFLYFSMDKNINEWKRGHREIGLEESKSYLVIDDFQSAIAKQYQLKEIPRYLLFDERGKLMMDDAPRPSEEEKLMRLLKP